MQHKTQNNRDTKSSSVQHIGRSLKIGTHEAGAVIAASKPFSFIHRAILDRRPSRNCVLLTNTHTHTHKMRAWGSDRDIKNGNT